MKARIFGACVTLLILGVLISRRGSESETLSVTPEKSDYPVFSEEPPDSVLSDTMLAGYAGESTSAAEDLEMIARYIDSVFLLVKDRDTADYSTNEDLVLFLHGSNSHHLSFLAKNGPALNGKGQLVDRWGFAANPPPDFPKTLGTPISWPRQNPLYRRRSLVARSRVAPSSA